MTLVGQRNTRTKVCSIQTKKDTDKANTSVYKTLYFYYKRVNSWYYIKSFYSFKVKVHNIQGYKKLATIRSVIRSKNKNDFNILV